MTALLKHLHKRHKDVVKHDNSGVCPEHDLQKLIISLLLLIQKDINLTNSKRIGFGRILNQIS